MNNAARPRSTLPLDCKRVSELRVHHFALKGNDMTEIPEGHSRLGASGAERWMKCPGSVELLKALHLPDSDEPDYRREGVALHEAGARLLEDDLEPYEIVGQVFNATPMTADLVNPLQAYINHCRPLMAATNTWGVEYRISSPVHPLFYGTADFWAVAPLYLEPHYDESHQLPNALHVVDLKGGEGIMVEVESNPQLMYYAFGVIDGLERQKSYRFDDNMEVVLTICQPRGFHSDGPVRSWVTTVFELKSWVHGVLVPAMLATEYDDHLEPGDWCRFCPAKLVCPLLTTLFEAAAKANPKHLPDTSDAALGLNYRYVEAVTFYVKALREEAYRRMMGGATISIGADLGDLKLIRKRSTRVWKDGAPELAASKFGQDAWTAPEIKSPAQLEKVPAAVSWVKEFAYSPDTGLTVAMPQDPKPGVKVEKLAERYAGVDLGEVT